MKPVFAAALLLTTSSVFAQNTNSVPLTATCVTACAQQDAARETDSLPNARRQHHSEAKVRQAEDAETRNRDLVRYARGY